MFYKCHRASGKVDKFKPALKITIHRLQPNLTFDVTLLDNRTKAKLQSKFLYISISCLLIRAEESGTAGEKT